MSWIKKHVRPIPRHDLISWNNELQGWDGSTFGPLNVLKPLPEPSPQRASSSLLNPYEGIKWKRT